MNFYISCSIKDGEYLKEVVSKLVSENHQATHWITGTLYSRSMLETSDALCIILPDFSFEYKIEALTEGVLSELVYALSVRKPIFIAYKRVSDNSIHIYASKISENLVIRGIPMTGNNTLNVQKIKEMIKHY